MALEKISLDKWVFALGEEESCLEKGREVVIPHTWNIEEGTEEYQGTGWYAYNFIPSPFWEGKRIQVLFRAVYHDAQIYLNGQKAGEHTGSGYTPFTVELTEYLQPGRENCLIVKVDNHYSEDMLPFMRSFDWANDGGIIRPAELLVTGQSLLKEIMVDAEPVITARDRRQNEGAAVFGLQARIDGDRRKKKVAQWELYRGHDSNLIKLTSGTCRCRDNKVELEKFLINDIKYWHFDSPSLYTVKITLMEDGTEVDRNTVTFGFREITVQGSRLYLNGEPVRLPGTEWMPGSNPAYGMAETKEQLKKMLLCLKESNSIFTRFHWQQDDWVYDWCDRHGMLVQEEVPFWGMEPPKAGERQWEIFCRQIQEMIEAHRNHPSIIFWGVGNELDAQCGETIQYIKNAVAYTHKLDYNRLANYVSNSIFKGHAEDGTTVGDIMMINDYIGTWHQGYEQYEEWDGIVKENPDKPMIPSEFGLCEPAFTGGDKRREEIFLEKIQCYRKYPNIVATVYFCLNDYRTQMGEEGEGKLRKRVHGSTGLCGEPKPSYYIVQMEYAPLFLVEKEGRVLAGCKDSLPCYAVQGYYCMIHNKRVEIPDLEPGESCYIDGVMPEDIREAKLYRPCGDRVL